MKKEAEIGTCLLDVARARGGLSSLPGSPALVLSSSMWKILTWG